MKLKSLTKTIGEFIRNEAGTYVTVFALATPAIFGAITASVEMSSISRIRAQLQAALDASALATGKHLAITTDEDVLSGYARDFFDSNLGSALEPEKISFGFQILDVPDSGKRIRVSANYDYDFYMKFLGMDERGKVRLSMKVVNQETGEDITEQLKAERDAERAQRDQQKAAGE